MRLIFTTLLLVIFIACDKTDRSDTGKIDSTTVSDSTAMDSTLSVEFAENAPAWFVSIPQIEGYIYATGTAKSRRASIASDKATLKAQVSMAEKLKKQGVINGTSEIALGADPDADNENLSIMMQDVMVKNKKQVKLGDIWYSYVLLELKQDN